MTAAASCLWPRPPCSLLIGVLTRVDVSCVDGMEGGGGAAAQQEHHYGADSRCGKADETQHKKIETQTNACVFLLLHLLPLFLLAPPAECLRLNNLCLAQ